MEVIFRVYLSEKNTIDPVDYKEYVFNLDEKIGDIKNKILKESFNDKFNNIDMENITDKVYKDYGKLFFDKGLLPCTIDNYKLSQFTNADRVFSFIVVGSNVLKSPKTPVNKVIDTGILKKIIIENRKDKHKNNDNGFVMYNDDFPPLK
jgi:hypothetical protein